MGDKPIAVDSAVLSGLFGVLPVPQGRRELLSLRPGIGHHSDGIGGAHRLTLAVPHPGGGGSGRTDTQLRASAVPVSVSGVATAANQTTANTSLSSIDTKLSAFSSGTSTVSSVNCSSAANLFASNSSAKSRWIYNPIGNGTLYVRLGSGSHTGVATSSFSVEGGQFICVFPLDYKGVVRGCLPLVRRPSKQLRWRNAHLSDSAGAKPGFRQR